MRFKKQDYPRRYGGWGVRPEEIIVKLQKITSQTTNRLGDLLIYHFGTARYDEIRAKIGDTGEAFDKLLNDYLDGLL